jgi:hypothetical protein
MRRVLDKAIAELLVVGRCGLFTVMALDDCGKEFTIFTTASRVNSYQPAAPETVDLVSQSFIFSSIQCRMLDIY